MSVSVFDRLSQRVVSEFLSTVVVVDDQAVLTSSEVSARPRTLTIPGRQGGGTLAGSVKSPASATASSHWLDAKRLIESFGRIGVACSVLRPDEGELGELGTVLSPLAKRSDVIILDWVLHEFKQGEKTIEILKDLLKSSGPDRGRARLVLIYTGENDLDQIVTSIRRALNLPEPLNYDDPFTIEKGAARICVYAKEQGRLPAATQDRMIEIAQLPTVVIEEFANLTSGLVSNVALRSLAVLRTNTYQLLKRFHRQLDPPYVTHSTLLAPEEASKHLVPLIVSEIQAVLEDEQVSELANLSRIVSWLRRQRDRGLVFSPPQHTTDKEFLQGLVFLLENGVSDRSLEALFENHSKFSKGFLKNSKKAVENVRDLLTETVTIERDRKKAKDHELAVLMSVRSRYTSPLPHLTLGSIVLETGRSRSRYLLCVQPRCDSVRLEGERTFPFLPIKKVSDKEKCDFILEEKGQATRLRLNDKPFEVRMITFDPVSKKRILARRVRAGRYFKATGTANKYRWVADLKPEQAQRVVSEYAHKLSRVGLTESEWLRRWMPRSGD